MKSKKESCFIQLKDRILLQAKLARYCILSALYAESNITCKLLQMSELLIPHTISVKDYFDTNRMRY